MEREPAAWQAKICGKQFFVGVFALVALITLGACGESTEETYQRGYDDGVDDVCNDIQRFSDRIYDVLESRRIC